MTDSKRDPHSDSELIDQLTDDSTPSQSGRSGGDMQRDLASRDELATAGGDDPQPTSVHKSDKPNDGDEPTLPNRSGDGDAGADRAPPRRT